MGETMLSYNPVLNFVAVVLALMASYTSIDLYMLMKSSERNKGFLFLGTVFSMGIGIWVMNFLGLLAMDEHRSVSYNIPLTLISMLTAVLFSGLAFFYIRQKALTLLRLIVASVIMTNAIFSSYVVGMYALGIGIEIDSLAFTLATIITFAAVFFSFWLLFYSKNNIDQEKFWVKPLFSFILTGAIFQAHMLLIRASSFTETSKVFNNAPSQQNVLLFLMYIIGFIIVSGLIGSSTIISKRLITSNKNLKDIKEALDASAIVAITDAKGKITYVNDKFVEISKYNEDELIGQDHNIVNSGYHSKDFFKELWKTIGQGRVWKGEVCNKAKDGSTYWVDTTIVPFLNQNGKPYQYVSIRSDITERKTMEIKLAESVQETSDYKFALDEAAIVAITDAKGKIIKVNDKFCEISKYSREELLGEDHRILNSKYHSKDFFKELWKTIGEGHVWNGEICNVAKDGTHYWVYTTIVPFVNEQGKPYQYIAIRHDITERKKQEEKIHQQDKLAAVGQLAAGVAHEIRNPLTSMKGYTEFLQLDETSEERLEYLDIILDEIERINGIVEEFMVLAKPKVVHLEEQNIIPIIKNVLSLLEFEARKKNVHLDFEYSEDIIQIECDENRLKQVFLNFVKNGIEAMPNGGDMIVRANVQDGHVQISFKDTGVGIPAEKLQKIGEPFFTTKKNGNGLGLMVSFKIIDSHKGKIYIESEINKGTTFNIVLPYKTA